KSIFHSRNQLNRAALFRESASYPLTPRNAGSTYGPRPCPGVRPIFFSIRLASETESAIVTVNLMDRAELLSQRATRGPRLGQHLGPFLRFILLGKKGRPLLVAWQRSPLRTEASDGARQ